MPLIYCQAKFFKNKIETENKNKNKNKRKKISMKNKTHPKTKP